MTRFTFFLSSGFVACLAACSSPSPCILSTPVHQGMSSARLASACGLPRHVQRYADGSEDWFYHFGFQQDDHRDLSDFIFNDAQSSYSLQNASTPRPSMSLAPVHLSPGGQVVGVIPAGSVVVP